MTPRERHISSTGWTACSQHVSPCLQVDSVLLSHPDVAEAVAFGTPDEKYGEIVAAAVVLSKPTQDTAAFAQDLRKHAGSKMSSFKVGPFRCSIACRAGLSEAGRQ